MNKKQPQNKNNLTTKSKNYDLLIIYLAVFVSVILLISTALLTYAYLTDAFEETDSTGLGGTPKVMLYEKVGQVYDEINNTNNYTLTFANKGQTLAPELYIKNDGDINTIVRLDIAVVAVNSPNNEVLNTNEATIINHGWVNLDISQPNTYSVGNLDNYSQPNANGFPFSLHFTALLNSVIEPDEYIKVFDSITLNQAYEFGSPYVLAFSLQLTTLAHSGNPYQHNEQGSFDSNYADGFSQDFLNTVWTAWKEQ